jgi:hypothetical protein
MRPQSKQSCQVTAECSVKTLQQKFECDLKVLQQDNMLSAMLMLETRGDIRLSQREAALELHTMVSLVQLLTGVWINVGTFICSAQRSRSNDLATTNTTTR